MKLVIRVYIANKKPTNTFEVMKRPKGIPIYSRDSNTYVHAVLKITTEEAPSR
jgi:hypothetical protein